MEQIGYIQKERLNLRKGINSIEEILASNLYFGDREVVENFEDSIQPVCSAMIITPNRKVLTINKTTKSTGNTSPEKDKTLLYVGGHLSVEDHNKYSNLETFFKGMLREVKEELNIDLKKNAVCLGVIGTYTPDTEKSQKHIGIIFTVLVDKEFETSFTDGKCKFVDYEDLKNIDNLESWSTLLYKHILPPTFSFMREKELAKIDLAKKFREKNNNKEI